MELGLNSCLVTHTHKHTQLRGVAGKRQVENAKVGLQQNFGIGGAAVVTLYKKYSPEANIQTLRARL